ncbi:hypothetical protein DMENIID0001_089250 [Sergentomyia squamirostris]
MADAAALKSVLDKMTELLQEMQKQNARNPQSAEVTATKALSKRILALTYSPEHNLTFDSWYRRYKATFENDAKSLDDSAKVRLLVRRLDAQSYERYAIYLLSRNSTDLTFKESISSLTKLFGKGESQFCTRRKCLQLQIRESDDLSTHAGIVNRSCEDFQLAACTPDHFKALIFVLSLQGAKYLLVRGDI